MSKIPDYAIIEPRIDFTDELYAAHIEDWDKVERALWRLRGVKETCLNHCCWVRIEPTAKTYKGLEKEIDRTRRKILVTIARLGGPKS